MGGRTLNRSPVALMISRIFNATSANQTQKHYAEEDSYDVVTLNF
jgi:hypothetical protein